jgi:hypothetical protein
MYEISPIQDSSTRARSRKRRRKSQLRGAAAAVIEMFGAAFKEARR